MDVNRHQMLARIAELYYVSQMTQEQIARHTGYSRSMISRLISEAHQNGVVTIQINHPQKRLPDLEQALCEALNLQRVLVLAGGELEYDQMLALLGKLAAGLLVELVDDASVIGISWGTAIHATVNALSSQSRKGVQVVQMIGSLGSVYPEIDGPDLARRLAAVFLGRYFTMPVPLVVNSESTRAALLAAPHIQRITNMFDFIDIALVGVGTLEVPMSSLLRAGYLSGPQLEELSAAGAIGDISAIHFNVQGDLVSTPFTRRFVGIDPDALQRIPIRMGVAGGAVKALPVIGACRAGLINMLVTDEATATGVLNILREEPAQNA